MTSTASGTTRWTRIAEASFVQVVRRRALRTFHGTTHIEGNTLNDEEVEEVLVEGPGSFSRRDSLEIINIRAATKFVDERAGDRDLDLDEALVRETHRRVLKGINDLLRPGEYRRGENRVTDGEGNLIFSTPVSGDVPALRVFIKINWTIQSRSRGA